MLILRGGMLLLLLERFREDVRALDVAGFTQDLDVRYNREYLSGPFQFGSEIEVNLEISALAKDGGCCEGLGQRLDLGQVNKAMRAKGVFGSEVRTYLVSLHGWVDA